MDGEESTELGGNFDSQIDIVILLNSWFYSTTQVSEFEKTKERFKANLGIVQQKYCVFSSMRR